MGVAKNPETDVEKANVMTTEEKVKLCFPTAKVEDGWATVCGRKKKVRGVKVGSRWLVFNNHTFYGSFKYDAQLWEQAWIGLGYPLRKEFRNVLFQGSNRTRFRS